jgi:hypothetical protein
VEDVLFIAGTVGFFALGLAYVRFCDRIIGPDPLDASRDEDRRPAEVER